MSFINTKEMVRELLDFRVLALFFLCKIHLNKLKTFLFGNNGARLSIDADNTSSKDGLFNKTKK
ncbi:hypothetical protein RSA42_13450 [Exiguobacterium indicum]|nr:hypothetical protein RSA42_13450 [Exiguobacterium indicum]